MYEREARLPLDAGTDVITEAIREIQRGSRLRLADPYSLAFKVRVQVARAELMAAALGLSLQEVEPSGTFYQSENTYESQVVTLVRVSRYGITVVRHAPSSGDGNGSLRLRLKLPK